MNLLSIVILILFVVYNLVVIKLTCIPTSLSATYYNLKSKYNCGWVFSLFLVVISLITMIITLDVTQGEPYQFLAFFTTIGTIFVGLSPNFRSQENTKVHFGFAILSLVSAMILIICIGYPILVLYNVLAAIYLVITKNKYKIYYIEINVFISMFITLILKTL